MDLSSKDPVAERIAALERQVAQLQRALQRKSFDPEKLATTLVDDCVKHVKRVVGLVEADLGDRIDAAHRVLDEQRRRLKAIEARPEVQYCGVWKSQPYMPGSLVTDRGALWYCNAETEARPGGPNSGWTLAVKSGFANGRDAR